jgi:hypothetical protein
MPNLTWQKSSYSGTSGCLEIAQLDEFVLVRDDTQAAVLLVTAESWKAFIDGAKAGEFDQDSPAGM